MARIRFRRREIYETDGPNKGPVFEAGQEISCSQDFADRWVRRGAADYVIVSAIPPVASASDAAGAAGEIDGDAAILQPVDDARSEGEAGVSDDSPSSPEGAPRGHRRS